MQSPVPSLARISAGYFKPIQLIKDFSDGIALRRIELDRSFASLWPPSKRTATNRLLLATTISRVYSYMHYERYDPDPWESHYDIPPELVEAATAEALLLLPSDYEFYPYPKKHKKNISFSVVLTRSHDFHLDMVEEFYGEQSLWGSTAALGGFLHVVEKINVRNLFDDLVNRSTQIMYNDGETDE